MRPSRLLTSFLVALAILAPGAPVLASGDTSPSVATNRLIVRFEKGTPANEMAAAHRRAGATVVEMIPALNSFVVEVPAGQRWLRSLQYRIDGDVSNVEDDPVVCTVEQPDDPYYNDVKQWGLFKIGAQQAWDITRSNPSICIAILDTGVQSTHPDLAGKVVAAADFTGSGSPEPYSNGHGTHVAGIAAASTDNAIGVAGLAWDASLINAKVMTEDGTGSHSWIAAGIVWATDNGADVINMSLGGTGTSSTLELAVNYAWDHGVVVVAAAGNNGSTTPFYPAAYQNCIGVAAAGTSDQLESWSNRGSWVSVAAPSYAYSTRVGSSYSVMQGTSQASPYVAGLAALVLDVVSDSNGNGHTNDEARAAIESSCVHTGIAVQYGRIDAAAAVATTPPSATGQVTGTVSDAVTSAPLASASVSDGTRSTSTDSQGVYVLAGVPTGAYSITASTDGYVSASQDVTVVAGETASANFSLQPVPAPNQAPILDAIGGKTVDEDTLLTFTVTATDPEENPLTFGVSALPQGAGFVDRVFSWTPADGQDGTHEMTFIVSDGALVDSETITIIVNAIARYGSVTGTVTDSADGTPIENALVSSGERFVTTGADGGYVLSGLPEGPGTLTATAVGYLNSQSEINVPAGGQTTADFALEPVPAPNQAPVLAPIGSRSVEEKESLEFSVSASDPDGNTLSYSADGLPEGATFVGQVLSWTPAIGQAGSYDVTFTVSDGELTDDETITIGVEPIPPYGTVIGTVTDAVSGEPVAGALVSNVENSAITDAQGNYSMSGVFACEMTLTARADRFEDAAKDITVFAGDTTTADFALIPLPNNAPVLDSIGNKSVDEDQLLTFAVTANDPDGDSLSYEATGLPDGAGFVDGVFEWMPADGQDGLYEVTFSVSDGELEDSETIAITVNAIARFGAIGGTVIDASTGDPIASATVSTGDAAATTGFDGSYQLAEVPDGSHIVSVTAVGYYDNTQEVSVDPDQTATLDFSLDAVPPPNQAPVLDTIGNRTVDEDAVLNFTVTATNLEEDTLTFEAAGLPDGATFIDRVFFWTPADGQDGLYEVTFTVSDGELEDSETITITVNAIARYGSVVGTVTDTFSGAPIENAMVSSGVNSAATGTDGGYVLNNLPEGPCTVTATADGYMDSLNAVDVSASDTTVADFALVALSNNAPVLDQVGNQQGEEGESLTFEVTASDSDGDDVTIGVYGLPDGADFAGGLFTWTPSFTQAGTYQVEFEASDGEQSDSETITITVTNVLTSGTIVGSVRDAATGQPLEGAAVSVGELASITDVAGEFVLYSAPEGGCTLAASAKGYEDAICDTIVLPGDTPTVIGFELVALPPPAETGTIMGVVTAAATGEPVEGATVTAGAVFSCVTGANGAYELTGLPPDEYKLMVSACLYDQPRQSVIVTAGEVVILDAQLNPVVAHAAAAAG